MSVPIRQVPFTFPHMGIRNVFCRSGREQSLALLQGSTTVTYGELHDRTQRLSRHLLRRGCSKGDRIGIWSENSPFFVVAYLAILQSGLVAVPFPVDSTAESFARTVREAGIKVILLSRRFASRIVSWAEQLGVRAIKETEIDGLPSGGTVEFPNIDPSRDLAALMFTSGSTGTPKGVMVTHRNIECNTQDIIEYMGLSATDRVMVVLPFCYCFGLSLLHTHLMAGASVVLNNQFMYPEKVVEDMLAKECTGLAGVPSTYQILLRKSRFKQVRFPALRWFQQAGGKLPNAFIEEILLAFPQVEYYLMYGQTEATARLSYLPPKKLTDKLGSIGKGLPSSRLEVLKPDGSPVTPGSDEVGEIVAAGDNVTLGYWNDPEETSRYFRCGKLYTGDLARVDADGFIYIVERDRDLIKSGGNRVSAKEVEEVIAELPAVVEVAVIGVPHDLLGEAVKAFVVAGSDTTISAAATIDYCRRRLPPFKCPESVEFLPVLPHNSSGKVLKTRLKQIEASAAISSRRQADLKRPCALADRASRGLEAPETLGPP
jgi:long-chain acyl-CoA synthetase